MNIVVACILAAVISFAIAFGLGYVVIPFLHKLKFGQTILDIGPAWHKSKEGTPTMGGVMFIAGSIIAFITGIVIMWLNGAISFESTGTVKFIKAVSAIVMAVCFGFIGFVDDFIKVKKNRIKLK